MNKRKRKKAMKKRTKQVVYDFHKLVVADTVLALARGFVPYGVGGIVQPDRLCGDIVTIPPFEMPIDREAIQKTLDDMIESGRVVINESPN